MERYVICHIAVQGFHKWEGAPEQLSYLAQRHRHIFEIRAQFMVFNNDRQIELISKQDEIKKYLLDKYGNKDGACEFGGMACEHIAEEIIDVFDAHSVEVLEDGYGGACLVR